VKDIRHRYRYSKRKEEGKISDTDSEKRRKKDASAEKGEIISEGNIFVSKQSKEEEKLVLPRKKKN
jgi:hypothetical protein